MPGCWDGNSGKFGYIHGHMQRRNFFQTTALAAMAGTLPAQAMMPAPDNAGPKIKLSVSSYSYWHFKGDK